VSSGRAEDTATSGHDRGGHQTGRRPSGVGLTIANRALVLQLLEWLAGGPRPHAEVMQAWRTSCPRLSIWEDALELGFVGLERAQGVPGLRVRLTPEGSVYLAVSARTRACRTPPSR
jgi:hypothetical protein